MHATREQKDQVDFRDQVKNNELSEATRKGLSDMKVLPKELVERCLQSGLVIAVFDRQVWLNLNCTIRLPKLRKVLAASGLGGVVIATFTYILEHFAQIQDFISRLQHL